MRMSSIAVKVLKVFALIALYGAQCASAAESACVSSPDGISDGPHAVLYWSSKITGGLIGGSNALDPLARFIKEIDSETCRFDDGRPVLGVLLPGYSQAFSLETDWSMSEIIGPMPQIAPKKHGFRRCGKVECGAAEDR